MVQCRINQEAVYDIDGILFDKDGTIIEFSSLWVVWAKKFIDTIIREADLPEQDKHSLAEAIGFQYKEQAWDMKGPLCIGSPDELIIICALHMYKQGYPWNEAMESVVNAYDKIEQNDEWKNSIKPVTGLMKLLEDASVHSLKLGVVTSDNYKVAIEHLKSLGIDTYFRSVTGHDQVDRGKPFPDMVDKACKEMNIRPERALIIGDSNGDMVLGKKSNTVASIGITAEFNHKKDHLKDADHIIENFKSVEILGTDKKGD